MANLTTQINTQISAMLCGSVVFVLTACGGGGGDTTPVAATPSAPKTLNDDFIAFKLAIIMFADGPLGNLESRTRGTPPYGWNKASGTETSPCYEKFNLPTQTTTYVNPDGIPSVGDKQSYSAKCMYPGSTLIQNADVRIDSEIVSLTSSTFSPNQDWSFITNSNSVYAYSYRTKLQGGEFSFAENLRVETKDVYTIAHSANDTEIQSSKRVAKFVETTLPVGSDLIRTTQYSCKYPTGVSANPDCSDTTVTIVGTLTGVTVNAKLTPVAGNPTKFEITDGAIKYSVQFTAHPTLQLDDKYAVTLPSGRVVNGSGEDVNWLGGTLY
jgi:hypothetical protein